MYPARKLSSKLLGSIKRPQLRSSKCNHHYREEFFLSSGMSINNYKRIKILGRGSFGCAVLSENKTDGSKVRILFSRMKYFDMYRDHFHFSVS